VLGTPFGSVRPLAAEEAAPEDANETQPGWPLKDNESLGRGSLRSNVVAA
jgi:hypothetical protein